MRPLMSLMIVVVAALAAGGAVFAPGASTSSARDATAEMATYGWPVKPFERQHPVRGLLGDPRFIRPGLRVLHFGIDIAAPNGTPVFAVTSGIAHRRGTRSVSIAVGAGRAFGYWHVVPAVRSGQRVARHQLIGHVSSPWEHLHFTEAIGGRNVNPLRPGAMAPYDDSSRPEIGEITFEQAGRTLSGPLGGTVNIAVGAFDRPAAPVRPPWDDVRMAPALVRWRIVGPRAGEHGRWHNAFDARTLLPETPFAQVYAAGTHQNQADRAGWCRFHLIRGWDTSRLADGTYSFQVSAVDSRGNEVVESRSFTVRNSASAARLLQNATSSTAPRLVAVRADLGTLGGRRSEATAVNELGQVAGWSETKTGARHAFLWQNGTMSDLGTLGGRNSEARSISGAGEVVGWSETTSGARHAFLWRKGRMKDLGTPQGRDSEAIAINERGQVLGNTYASRSSRGALTESRAVLWSKGRIVEVSPANWIGEAVALNERGTVIGTARASGTGSSPRAFMWRNGEASILDPRPAVAVAINDRDQSVVRRLAGGGLTVMWNAGTIVTVGRLGGRGGARAISKSGQVVGARTDPTGMSQAFTWRKGRMTKLWTPAGGSSAAHAVNDRDQILGWVSAPGRRGRLAAVWQGGGRPAVLGPARPGRVVTSAINTNRSQVVGSSVTAGGRRRAAIWTLHRPTVEAAFAAESYRPGATAKLVLFGEARDVTIRLYRVGASGGRLRARDVMRGEPVAPARRMAYLSPSQSVRLSIGRRWKTGFYFARLEAPGGRIGYAPFVLAPRRLGEHRIAVVLPTQSWQAYNFRDDDADGAPDTWYASPTANTARLSRPFVSRGVPPRYSAYDEPFLRWIEHNRYGVDYLSDAELKETDAATLAGRYDLLIFEGHHEYVTAEEYDAVEGFRDRGGSLMFLSGNNFFRKVTISGSVMRRINRWRRLGRPEAALIGVQWYLRCASPTDRSQPWIVRRSRAGNWIFRGTGLNPGAPFAGGGIEADRLAASSPRNVQVVAEIPNLFGDGRSAQMTYYRAPSGAQVFAAGAFTLAGSVWQPPVRRMMANLIDRLGPQAR